MTSSACSRHRRRVRGCPECCRISSAYERKRYAARRAGTLKPRVARELVERHVDMLLAAGASVPGIAEAARLPVKTIYGLRRRTWVQGETAAAILAVAHAEAPLPVGLVPVVVSSRQVQALAAIGWSLSAQARELGCLLQQVWRIANATHSTISRGNADAVRALFERWCGTPGPSKRSRTEAARKGWLPPLAWDDIADPNAVPLPGEAQESERDVVDEVAVERALAGEQVDLTDAELVAAVQAGTARGEALTTLAVRLGVNHLSAKRMLAGELSPRKAKQAAVLKLLSLGGRSDADIAAEVGLHYKTVARTRLRLAAETRQVAS